MLAVLGFGLLLRECKRAQEVEADDPEVADLDFLLNSRLGVEKMEDILTSIGSVLSKLEKDGNEGLKEAGDNTVAEQADEPIQPATSIGKKRKGSEKTGVGKKAKKVMAKGTVVDKQVEESSKRQRVKSKKALGEAF